MTDLVQQTEEERRELIALAQAGDEKARNKLAETNSRLIFRAMKYIKRGGFSLEEGDLYTHGYFGLLEAIGNFNLDRKWKDQYVRFSTYAVKCCFRHMLRGLHNEGRLIRLPVHVIEGLGEMVIANREHLAETGETLTEEELAVELDFTGDKVRLYIDTLQPILSLETPVQGKHKDCANPYTLADFIPGERSPYTSVYARLLVGEALDILDERTRYIIKKIDFEGHTLKELSEDIRIQLSRERVRGIRNEGLKDMKLYILRKLQTRNEEKAYRIVMR